MNKFQLQFHIFNNRTQIKPLKNQQQKKIPRISQKDKIDSILHKNNEINLLYLLEQCNYGILSPFIYNSHIQILILANFSSLPFDLIKKSTFRDLWVRYKVKKKNLSEGFPLDFTKFQFNRISLSADLFFSFLFYLCLVIYCRVQLG